MKDYTRRHAREAKNWRKAKNNCHDIIAGHHAETLAALDASSHPERISPREFRRTLRERDAAVQVGNAVDRDIADQTIAHDRGEQAAVHLGTLAPRSAINR